MGIRWGEITLRGDGEKLHFGEMGGTVFLRL